MGQFMDLSKAVLKSFLRFCFIATSASGSVKRERVKSLKPLLLNFAWQSTENVGDTNPQFWMAVELHCKKKVSDFLVPSRDDNNIG